MRTMKKYIELTETTLIVKSWLIHRSGRTESVNMQFTLGIQQSASLAMFKAKCAGKSNVALKQLFMG